jgi:hypothetical protein
MTRTRPAVAAIAILLAGLATAAVAQNRSDLPEDSAYDNPVDAAVTAAIAERGILPGERCSDEVFVRRVFLDVIGTLPTPDEVRSFLRDRSPDKRSVLIEELLEREEFADYWALRWGDVLRIKSEFPINLWPNAVQAYHRWVRDAAASNMPHDVFARELLTSSGSNFRVPQVNFYRAIQGREPSTIASAVALTFMGARFEDWPEARREGMEAFFSRVAFKKTAEWKEEIVLLDPAATGPVQAVFPDGVAVTIAVGADPRARFADWLTAPDNPFFARAAANRVWFWLLGRGIVEPPDDLRPSNPPSNPELLAVLESALVVADFDLRHLYRLILNSDTYQRSAVPGGENPDAEALFAHYPVRRLDAEVLIDALCQVFDASESYSSRIPEPYTFVPASERTIALADGSISSPFLELFGRPSRDTGFASERSNQPTEAQRLHLLNSTHIQRMIERSRWLAQLGRRARRGPDRIVEEVYLRILSRPPNQHEVAAVLEYGRADGVTPRQTLEDLCWALVNSKEFLYRH